MKKYFYLAAVSAMMLTACTSEKDVLETKTGPAPQEITQQAVGFDVYVPAATASTRAGLEGTMTTNRLQRSDAGFGVYAYLTEDINPTSGDANATGYTSSAGQDPNFMVNEQVLWNSTNLGWYYSPLKYWPNETDNDSQTTPAAMTGDGTNNHLDRLTFFAYAPYVSAGSVPGITAVSDKNGQLNTTDVNDPTIAWQATTAVATFNPNEGVDLLWGVAPAGGLSYTAVNGRTVSKAEGTPLIDMTKPDVNTSMKFLFQHALARIGINVVAAVDQVSPGGELDPNTKITINSLKITGPFGTSGELNLNNAGKPGVAHWTKINSTVVSSAAPAANNSSITVTANDAIAANNYIAENLRWAYKAGAAHTTPVAQPVVGVTTAKQDLLAPSTKWFTKKAGTSTPYTPAKVYYTAENTSSKATAHYTTVAGDAGKYYTKASGTPDVYTAVTTSTVLDSPVYPAVATQYYKLTVTGTYPQSGSDPAKTTGYYTESGGVYTYVSSAITWGSGTETYYTVEATPVLASEIPFAYTDATIYEAERNYLYVVPTNAALNANYGTVAAGDEATMRTIKVQIEYYINTKDDKLANGFAETKNVITKDVVLPSLANGKSYMLNLVLGLTSVKIEAEVDDWKLVNVQADLPQNTAE